MKILYKSNRKFPLRKNFLVTHFLRHVHLINFKNSKSKQALFRRAAVPPRNIGPRHTCVPELSRANFKKVH